MCPLDFSLLFASAASLVVVSGAPEGWSASRSSGWHCRPGGPLWFLTNAPIEAASRTLFIVMDVLIVSTSIPVAAGVAILRYRLYDIDPHQAPFLAQRAPPHTLVILYFGGILVLQRLFSSAQLSGQQSTPGCCKLDPPDRPAVSTP